MPPNSTARTIRFINVAHAYVHFVVLIYPTAVIAIAARVPDIVSFTYQPPTLSELFRRAVAA